LPVLKIARAAPKISTSFPPFIKKFFAGGEKRQKKAPRYAAGGFDQTLANV
jgi:hypothetical protein